MPAIRTRGGRNGARDRGAVMFGGRSVSRNDEDPSGNNSGLSGALVINAGSSVTDNGDGTFTFAWTTNIPATSRVEFGPDATPDAYTFYQEDPTLSMSHSITLTAADGLVAGSAYDWRMVSAAAAGNTAYGTTGASTAGTITVTSATRQFIVSTFPYPMYVNRTAARQHVLAGVYANE